MLVFCRLSLTSQSCLRRCRPDLLALLPAAGLLRCSGAPGGGAADRWASRPSGEVWVEAVEEDAVPLPHWAPFSLYSAKGENSKSEGGFSSHCMTERKTLTRTIVRDSFLLNNLQNIVTAEACSQRTISMCRVVKTFIIPA